MEPARNAPCPCGSGRRYKACCGAHLGDAAPASAPVATAPNPQIDAQLGARLGQLVGLMRAGQAAALEAGARALLEQHPDLGPAWQLLAVALGQQGKDALAAWARAAALVPGDPAAHNNLANALARAGRAEEAAASYRHALALAPDLAEAHENLGLALAELGRLDEAAASLGQAVVLRPSQAGAHDALGSVLHRLGRLDEAAGCYGRALALDPAAAETEARLGEVLSDLGRIEDAAGALARAVRLRPGFAEAHANLANALRALGRLDEAIARYDQAVALKPDLPLAHANRAGALRLAGRYDEAEAACARALTLAPDLADALAVRAEIAADQGRFPEAEALFRQAAALDADAPEIWAGLSRTRRMTAEDGDWRATAERIAALPLPPQRALHIRYALGKYHDDLKAQDAAFDQFEAANALSRASRPPHDRAAVERRASALIAHFDAGWVTRTAGRGVASERPVFVIGMPRSGTTLAEQILASHPAGDGIGESPFWGQALAGAEASFVRGGPDPADLGRLAGAYLALLDQRPHTKARVADKMPANILAVGLIHAALPGARFVHMRRHPADTGLSIFSQHFEATLSWATDLGDLAHYYRQYERIMDHWRAVLPPGVMMDLPYEGLVEDQEGWTRRLLDFVGLPWDARCLEFHRAERAVITASKWQVRQPLNASAVARWRRYAHRLGPLLELAAED